MGGVFVSLRVSTLDARQDHQRNPTHLPRPHSRKIILPVPASGRAVFSISGRWRVLEEEGPDPTVVVLKCRARLAKRSEEYRLTGDATFRLPKATIQAELEILSPSDHVDLRVTIAPVPSAAGSSYERG